MNNHETLECNLCNKYIPKEDHPNHKLMHENHKKQMKALGKGKVVKTKTKAKTSGQNVFVKKKFNEIADQHKDLSNAEKLKLLVADGIPCLKQMRSLKIILLKTKLLQFYLINQFRQLKFLLHGVMKRPWKAEELVTATRL